MKMKRFASVLGVALVASASAFGQADGNGPTALITTYRAKPEARVKFRAIMRNQGIVQLERWKKAGLFASYQALFTTYAADTVPDMFLVLRFNHFTDLERWQQIEETYPGGLPTEAQTLAAAETSGTADIVKESVARPSTGASQFFVLEYDVLVPIPKYVSYVLGYAVPQFDAWERAGVLSSYAAYVNQNPPGAPWSSFIVLEYKDLASLAQRETVKNKTRDELAGSDPSWKKWSDDKTAVRTEKAAIPVRSLVTP